MNDEMTVPSKELNYRIRQHIRSTWCDLTRDLDQLAAAIEDPKIDEGEDLKHLNIYVSAREDIEHVRSRIKERLSARDFSRIDLRVLPAEPDNITEHGLLYLPGPYLVPGGRFNEFYGWDSYFIQRGLIRDGLHELAASLVEQALYEVDHYGTLLNANRTYYLSRSHPPVLSMMIKEQFLISRDHDWLRKVIPLLEKFYYYWKTPPHLNQATGLSRYHDMGSGPAPEVEFSEKDAEGRSHYERVRDYLREATIDSYDKNLYYNPETDSLTDLAYIGDRSMRESGFDPTDRFGPLNLDVIHYAPVCLNVLIFRMETDLANFHATIGEHSLEAIWRDRAMESASHIDRYFWSESAGMYFDYHLRDEKQRNYPYLTTFWPLWAGLATRAQAEKVCNNLECFLYPGGLATSTVVTGEQWDAPFAWAPLQLFAVDGLERYGYHREAGEVARRFTMMVAKCFAEDGCIREKYDARLCSSSVGEIINFGYSTNEVGFGWTNAVTLEFLDRFFPSGRA